MARADATRFTVRRSRDSISREKDAATLPIVRRLRFRDPKTANVLILPCLTDPVIEILINECGVPRENIRAGERDREIWRRMKTSPYLRGVRLPSKPRPISEDIDYVRAELDGKKLDLVYLDFFGQPTTETFTVLQKIFRYNLLARRATLLVTTLLTRSKSEQSDFNKDVRVRIAPLDPKGCGFLPLTAAYIEMAAKSVRYRKPMKLVAHPYVSMERKTGMRRACVLTEARWT